MAHFINNFSSPLSGPCCPVAVDDEKKKVRYPLIADQDVLFVKGGSTYSLLDKNGERKIKGHLFVLLWTDYPESHHTDPVVEEYYNTDLGIPPEKGWGSI
jgi:hypothetical protein